ncbi:Uncharacterised protein [Mycobacteroides abscessus]|nr:Uncharacterised protein [Mycobacteroides abscessus]
MPSATSAMPTIEKPVPGIVRLTCPAAMMMPPYRTERRDPITRSASQPPTTDSRYTLVP